MKRPLAIAAAPAALAGLALIAAGCGGGGGSQAGTTGPGYAAAGTARTARAATVSTGHTKLGTVLVDGQGRTLYLFEKDKGVASSCSGACASIWPPLTTAAKSVAGRGLSVVKLGSVKRPDGKTEVTYAGHPLYTYAGDTKLGDTQGQGLNQFGGRAGRLAVPLLSLAGIGVAAGSLAGLLLSEGTGLFGFMETGYRPAILLSIGLEATTIALLSVHLALRRRPHAPRAEHNRPGSRTYAQHS
jgi:predicted lipoprotein with Yx(FWY)xxD motif